MTFFNRQKAGFEEAGLLIVGCIFFLFLSIAAGGGNYPGLQARDLIYLKAFALFLPYLYAARLFLKRQFSFAGMLRSTLKPYKYLYLYLIFCACSLPMAISFGYSLNRLLYTCFGIFGVMIYVETLKVKQVQSGTERLILWLSCIYAAILSTFLIYCLLGLAPHDSFRQNIQQLNLTHPNLLSSLLLQFACALYFVEVGTKNLRMVCLILLMLFIILLFSRTVVFSMLVIAFVVCIIKKNKKDRIYILIASGFLVCVAAIALPLLPNIGLFSFISRGADSEAIYTLTNRTLVWKQLLDTIDWKIILFGNGYGVVTKDFGIDFGTGILYGAHNSYLSILFGSGILALISFLLFLSSALLINIQNYIRTNHAKNLVIICSIFIFTINSLTAEEAGVNITANFAFMLLLIMSQNVQDKS